MPASPRGEERPKEDGGAATVGSLASRAVVSLPETGGSSRSEVAKPAGGSGAGPRARMHPDAWGGEARRPCAASGAGVCGVDIFRGRAAGKASVGGRGAGGREPAR